MKIGITVNLFDTGYGRYGEDLYLKIKQFGYDAIDLSMADTSSVLYTIEQSQIESILLHHKQLAEAAGVEIYQVHGPWRFPPKDLEVNDRSERLDKMKKAIYFTALLGCKYFVVHPLLPYGNDDIDTNNQKATYDINKQFFSELLITAKEHDVTICLENMPWHKFSFAKPEAILKFVKDINDNNFKICLDVGHVNVHSKLDIAHEVKRLGKYIKAVHVHDNVAKMDLHLFPLFGSIDFNAFVKALKEIDFDGVFSLETNPSHKLPTPIFESMSKELYNIAKHIVG